MSGFIASPPAPASPPGSTVAAGDFWPEIDVNLFRDAMRIGNQAIPHARVSEALIGGIVVAADNLAEWRAEQEAAGHASLAAVPAQTIAHGTGTGNGSVAESRLVILFRRAVHAFAAADLIETHRDLTASPVGEAQAWRQAVTPDDHRRNAIHAIRAILDRPRTAVELI